MLLYILLYYYIYYSIIYTIYYYITIYIYILLYIVLNKYIKNRSAHQNLLYTLHSVLKFLTFGQQLESNQIKCFQNQQIIPKNSTFSLNIQERKKIWYSASIVLRVDNFYKLEFTKFLAASSLHHVGVAAPDAKYSNPKFQHVVSSGSSSSV